MSSPEMPELSPLETPQIVVAGGGGGASVMAAGLAEALPYASVTALVCMSDGGGSTGALRDQFNTPPVGDVRKCTSALCPDPAVKSLFEQRLGPDDSLESVALMGQGLITALQAQGRANFNHQQAIEAMRRTTELAANVHDLRGHTFGNFVLTALTLKHENITDAAAEVGTMLDIRGRVVPVTNDPHQLVLYDGQRFVEGEGEIDTHHIADSNTARVWLSPNAHISDEARVAIEQADAMLVGPGSVFTSLLPVLAVGGMAQALKNMQGQMIAVANLVTQNHETSGWDVADYLRKLEQYTHRPFDYVLYNNTHDVLPETEQPVIFNRSKLNDQMGNRIVAIGADLTDAHEVKKDPNDKLAALRSSVHHNPRVIARVLDEEILSASF